MGLFIGVIISTIGLAYFIYGKKSSDIYFLIAGIILMIYPYCLSGFLVIITGIVLLMSPFIAKKYFE